MVRIRSVLTIHENSYGVLCNNSRIRYLFNIFITYSPTEPDSLVCMYFCRLKIIWITVLNCCRSINKYELQILIHLRRRTKTEKERDGWTNAKSTLMSVIYLQYLFLANVSSPQPESHTKMSDFSFEFHQCNPMRKM